MKPNKSENIIIFWILRLGIVKEMFKKDDDINHFLALDFLGDLSVRILISFQEMIDLIFNWLKLVVTE